MFQPKWITGDERRLTLADLQDILERAFSVIEQEPYAPEEHGELLTELEAVIDLCKDAAMTAGELTLPAK